MSIQRQWKVFAKEKIIDKDNLVEGINVDMLQEFKKWYKKKYECEMDDKIDEGYINRYIRNNYGKYAHIMFKSDDSNTNDPLRNNDKILQYMEEKEKYGKDLKCKYCNKKLSLIQSKQRHEKTCKFQNDEVRNLEIELNIELNIEYSNTKCRFCDKEMRVDNLQRHESICKKKKEYLEELLKLKKKQNIIHIASIIERNDIFEKGR